MKLERSFKKPLERQVREGVELEMCTADIVMNSKAEWNGSRIPRIIIEEREKQTGDKNSGMSRTTGENRKRSLKVREAKKGRMETGGEKGEKRLRKETESEVDQNRGDHSIKQGERAEMRIKWRQNESRKKQAKNERILAGEIQTNG